jgi:hypothetical protein
MTMEQRSMESRGQVRHCSPRRGTQRGVTLFGLMFWAILIGIVSLLSLKVLPTLNEYFTIKRTVEKIATSGATTVPEIRTAFEKQKDIEYSIQSITGKDLDVVLFEVLSAFATCGLSQGLTPDLPDSGKYLLTALMFLGRTGTMSLAAALALRERPKQFRLAEERPIVG